MNGQNGVIGQIVPINVMGKANVTEIYLELTAIKMRHKRKHKNVMTAGVR